MIYDTIIEYTSRGDRAHLMQNPKISGDNKDNEDAQPLKDT